MTVRPSPLAVVVAVPTFRRPAKLAALLAALPDRVAEVSDVARCEVVVVDNDPAGSAAAVVAAAPLPARHVVEPTPGIAAVRNRALDEAAGADLLAFIDDDEQPRPGWLAHLVRTWTDASEPTLVMGRVISMFEPDVDPWVLATGQFRRPPRPTGLEIPVAATGNLLVDLPQLERLGVRFDPELGLAGGEDMLFSRQLVARGGRIVWCNESEAEDFVPADRTTRRWTMRRAYSNGNLAVVLDLRLATGTGRRAVIRSRYLVGGVVRCVVGFGRHLAGETTRNVVWSARGLRAAHRGRGMVTGALGHVHRAYARAAD